MKKLLAALLLLVAVAGFAAEPAPDPAHRFLGIWEGPANVYDDYQVMKPTNASLLIKPGPEPGKYIVELTVFEDKLTRFMQCEIKNAGELTVREEVMVDLRKVRVQGLLKSRNGRRIEEGHIRFFVETPQGDYRPYYAVKFAAQRAQPKAAEASPTPEEAPTPTPEATPTP
jgi:hypothetical protein